MLLVPHAGTENGHTPLHHGIAATFMLAIVLRRGAPRLSKDTQFLVPLLGRRKFK